MSDAARATSRGLVGLVMGVVLGAAVSGLAQPATTVPAWVVRYASNLEADVRECRIKLSQEQDRAETLQKTLATVTAERDKLQPPNTPPPHGGGDTP